MAAHFFVFYYGCASLITPPVCLVVYITATIANAPIMKTGFLAMRLGILTFILPFIFVYSPELLLIGSIEQILLVSITSIIGVILMAGGLQGYFLRKAGWLLRIILLSSGLSMVVPGWMTDIAGLAGCAIVILLQVKQKIDAKV